MHVLMTGTPPLVRSSPIDGVEDLYHTYSPRTHSQASTPFPYVPTPEPFTTADQQRQSRGSLGGEVHNGPNQFPPFVPPFARYSYFAFEPRERPPFSQYQAQDVPRDGRFNEEGYREIEDVNMSGYQVDPRLTGGNMMPSHDGPHGGPRPMGSMSSNVGGYPSDTPPSAGFQGMGGPHHGTGNSNSPSAEGQAGMDQQAIDHKRQRACEGCRQLKVRCEPDPENPQGTCRRCAKAHRECIFTAPTRKRQKRTDSRVAELEKKIDQLTASLAARRRGEVIDEDSENEDLVDAGIETSSWKPNRNTGRRAREESFDAASQGSAAKRQRTESGDRKSSTDDKAMDGDNGPVPVPNLYPFLMPSTRKVTALPTPETESGSVMSPPQGSEYLDVVDRRLLSMDLASQIFDKYNECYVPNMPAVTFPEGTTASQIRKTRPTLFLAILSVASMTFSADLCRTLNKEFVKTIAERVVVNGEKSLELVQALLVAVLWFHPPEHFEELKFYQFAHMCAVMAIDIGLSRKSRPLRSKLMDGAPATPAPPPQTAHGFANALQGIPGLHGLNSINESMTSDKTKAGGKDHMWRDHPWRKNPFPDPGTIESRVTFLGCYFICANTSLTLRRPNLIRFSSYITECIEVIESSSEANEGQKLMAHLVKIHRIAEEVGIAFSYDDPYSKINVSDSRIEFQLKGFERQVEEWRKELVNFSPAARKRLNLSNYLIWLYMHEVALHVDHAADDFRPPFAEDTVPDRPPNLKHHDTTLSQFHIDSIFTCYTAAHSYINHFMSFTVDEIRTLPAMMFVRTAYALVVLMKLLFSSGQPRSELGRVVDMKALKLEFYIEKLQNIFKVVAEGEKSKAAQKFAMILTMLSTWYARQKADKDGKRKGEISIPALMKMAKKLKEVKETGALDDILSGDMSRSLPGGKLPQHVESALNRADLPPVLAKVIEQALKGIGGIPPMLLYIANTGTIPPIAQPVLQQIITTGVIPPHIQAFMSSGGFNNFPEALKTSLELDFSAAGLTSPGTSRLEIKDKKKNQQQKEHQQREQQQREQQQKEQQHQQMMQQQQQQQQQQAPPPSQHSDPMDAPTPLHMLSDVAMGTEEAAASLHGGSIKSLDDATPSYGTTSPGDVSLFDGSDDMSLNMGVPLDFGSMLSFGGMGDFGLGMLDPGSFMPMGDDAFWGQDQMGQDPNQIYTGGWP